MKLTLIGAVVVCAVGVSGCTDSAKEMHFPAMPAELKDCKIFAVNNNSGGHIKIARCPNSTTTTTDSKGTESVVVVDGVEYTRKERK